MPGYHNRKKKLYKMGGEMDSYNKGGKMPSWLVEMFKKKAKKSMNLGGNLTGGKLEKATRRAGDEVNEYYGEDTESNQMLENLGAKGRGAEKRFGVVTRYDDDGNPYAVKKGLLNETELLTNPMLDTDDEDYIVGKVKNRNKLGKMLLGSDAKAEFGKGGKMYYVTGGELDIDPRRGGGAQPEKKAPVFATPPEDDIPALDPNASWLQDLAVEEDDGLRIQEGFRIEGEGPRIKGLTLGSETTNRVGGTAPEMATMYLTDGEGKMQKKVEKLDPEPNPDPEPTPDPIPPRKPTPTPTPEPDPEPVPDPRTPSDRVSYANVGSYFNPGGERVYRDYGDGDVRAVGGREHSGEGDRRDLIPTGLRGDDGQAYYASRDVYQMMQDEGVDPYSPAASMFMEDAYSSNPELFGTNYQDSEVMRYRMLHNDKGITQAGREGKDSGYFFPDQLFGRMTPEQRRQQDIANVRAQQASYKQVEAERKRKAAERREQDIAKANALRRAQSKRMAGGGKLYHFGS